MFRGPPAEEFFTVEGSRVVSCAPDVAMARVLNATAWPAWQPEIKSTEGPERVAVGDVVTGRALLLGFGVHGQSRAEEVGPTHFSEDVLVGVRMRVTYQVRTVPDGTLIEARLIAHEATGFSGRVLTFFLKRRLRRMQRNALDLLVKECEGRPLATDETG